MLRPMMLGRTVKYLAATAPSKRRSAVVLIYHHVGGKSGTAVDLEPALFVEPLCWLHEHRRAVSTDHAVQALVVQQDVDDVVVFTFDDGTADFADQVVPSLMERTRPVIVFAATEVVDRNEPFPWAAPPISLAALRDAGSTGASSLWARKRPYTYASPARSTRRHHRRRWIDRSVARIANELGAAPRHFRAACDSRTIGDAWSLECGTSPCLQGRVTGRRHMVFAVRSGHGCLGHRRRRVHRCQPGAAASG